MCILLRVLGIKHNKPILAFGTSNMNTNIEEGFAVCYIIINGVVIQVKEESDKYELIRWLWEEAAN